MEITFFYIPIGSESEATNLGDLAIDKKLAACSNVFPITSAFPWNGKLEKENEFVLVLKTIHSLTDSLRSFIVENHPYDVPCIMSWSAEVNESYGKWMKEQLVSSFE
ncbi:MAG: divalent-cation tolerance protein CutA [Saprospiraceae bacterium]|nr:divalent-cation tolerance protein CutA [Saprospiraceae bacterium]